MGSAPSALFLNPLAFLLPQSIHRPPELGGPAMHPHPGSLHDFSTPAYFNSLDASRTQLVDALQPTPAAAGGPRAVLALSLADERDEDRRRFDTALKA
jgi:hypothetical protein